MEVGTTFLSTTLYSTQIANYKIIKLYGARHQTTLTPALVRPYPIPGYTQIRCDVILNQTKRCSRALVILHHKKSVSHAHLCMCHRLDPTPSEDHGYVTPVKVTKFNLVTKLCNVLGILYTVASPEVCVTHLYMCYGHYPCTPSEDHGSVTPVRVTKCNLVTKLSDVLGILHHNSIS